MSSLEFQCPQCSLPLRVRDRTFVGRSMACPECGTPLVIEAEGDGTIFARRVEPVEEKASLLEEHSRSPSRPYLLIGGALILVVIGIYSAATNRETEPFAEPSVRKKDQVTVESDQDDVKDDGQDEPVTKHSTLSGQYPVQAARYKSFLESNGQFPAQVNFPLLSSTESLSWIAVLEAHALPDEDPPLWDRPWNDALNDRFVRRKLDHFLNPAIPRKTSPDRYPATHFVGLAGVGSDAAELPRTHPNAGMFGWNRSLSPEEIPDGTANTMMVTGVMDEIGAWAAGGSATVRPLTAGPLIKGPDHFGTGSRDELLVLMADGSTRTLSRETDIEVVKKMIAINDTRGLTPAPEPKPVADSKSKPEPEGGLAAFDNWEPLIAPQPEDALITMLLQQIEADRSPEQQPKEPEKPIDVDVQLAQKLELFEMPKALPLEVVLDDFYLMSRVPLVVTKEELGVAENRLQFDVQITLNQPTLKQVLEALLHDAGLGYRVEEGKIVLTPRR